MIRGISIFMTLLLITLRLYSNHNKPRSEKFSLDLLIYDPQKVSDLPKLKCNDQIM